MNPVSKLVLVATVLVAVAIYSMAGISSISPGEVGILIKNVGDNRGMQKEVLHTGMHWVDPWTYDVVTYDARQRQMEEVNDLPAQTGDGQPVTVNFSVQLGLQSELVPVLHEQVGPDYYTQVVHPAIIQVVKNKVPSKKSDEVYTSAGREGIEQAINDEMKARFAQYGITTIINLKDLPFKNGDYVKILEAKAKATQQIDVETRLASAAIQESIKKANSAEGVKQQRIKAAEAQREEQRLSGEGTRLRQEEEAKGVLAVATAEAKGTELRRLALSGAGGENLVSIEWAKNLGPNVKVYAVPTGAPGTTSLMDLNGIMQGALSGRK
jgi:regulator of protease activity HflC (stomatin/prohibitin superfamily)